MGRVDRFLELYPNKNTAKNYRQSIRLFFRSVYGEGDFRAQAEQYFEEDRDYERDLQDFLTSLNGRPPKTIRLRISCVKMFLLENNMELSQKSWRRLRRRIKGNRARTIDTVPSNEELKRIVHHLPINGKALYLTLASSGMRIGEALQLQLDDVDLTTDPVKMTIRGEYTKTGNPRIAFVSNEAKESLVDWLRTRADYLTRAVRRSHRYEKSEDDTRLFCFGRATARMMWHNALEKAGLDQRDPSTRFHRRHNHVLRKFFRTKMGSVIPVDVAEALMGHEGYLTEVYRRYSVEDLAKFYKQGEHALHMFTDWEEVGQLRAEIEEKNKRLQTIVNGVTAENLELKSKIARLDLENTGLKDRLNHVEGRIAEIERLTKKSVEELRSEVLRRFSQMPRSS
jgi:integrase